MPNVARPMEDTIGLAARYLGWSWPNPWWTAQTNAADDCAAFISWLLYGLNSYGNPVFTYVSQLQNNIAYGQRFYSKQGIQRGDVAGFSWEMDPNSYDHTEMALTPADAFGFFLTIGTNASPGDDVRVRTRHVKYITSYFRPNYPSPAGAGVPAPTPEEIEEEDMSTIFYKDAENGFIYAFDTATPSGQPALTVLGRAGSGTIGFLVDSALPKSAVVKTLTGAQMAQAAAFYGVKPVSAAFYAQLTKPPALSNIKGLVSV